MSVLDTVKEKARELADKANTKANDLSGPAGDALNSAKTAVAHGLDGASKFVDEKTGGKYASAIHTGVDKAKGFLGHDQAGQPDQAAKRADQPQHGGQSEQPGGSAGTTSAGPQASTETTGGTQPSAGPTSPTSHDAGSQDPFGTPPTPPLSTGPDQQPPA